MFSWPMRIVGAALPVAALLVMVGGPAPSAAYAECRARVDRERQANHEAQAAEQTGTDASHKPSEPAPAPQGRNEPATMTSVVSVEVAKPGGSGAPRIIFTPVAGPNLDPARPLVFGQVSSDRSTRRPVLHHPAYRAHAPPAGAFPIV
jgi:hypothetical protein